MLNVKEIRKDFPILDQEINGRKLVYLDSGASSQKPLQVIEAIQDFYQNHYANIHRGIYNLSAEATEMYDGVRKTIAKFINARSWREIVFTRNATESVNLVAFSWALNNLQAGDVILLSELEHHANIVPWQQVCQRTGAELRYIPIDQRGYLQMDKFDELLDERVKLLAITAMSNVLGTIPAVNEMVAKAHAVGALALVDGAQSVPHMPTDVQAMDCDFLVFSGHKMLGPSGVGVLYGKRELLEKMPPFMTGGDMILSVSHFEARWADVPQKFEAGTPAIAEAIGLGKAVDYLSNLGMANVRQHEIDTNAYALKVLSEVEGLRLYGPLNPEERGGAVTFTLGDIHAHDLGSILNERGIAIRAGHHCAMPLHRTLQIPASARASHYIYNTPEDFDRLVEGLNDAVDIFGG